LGYADLIEDGLSPDSDLVANIRNIQGAANRAASMTRQLLAFARRQPSQSMVVSPNELLMDFTRLLKPLLTSDVELVMLPGDDVGNVEIDPNHLEQIIMNLAVNSRDAMQLGGKLILKTENATFSEPHLVDWMAALPGNYVRISVTDTGIGMTDEVKQHIFEPFFTTKDSGKGTGLGLATVYGLVKQAKGFIWSHSQVGIGTTIDIYLPCVVTVQASAVKEDKVAELGGRELVLVVEDEPLVRELTVKALRKAGYSVLTAENGAEALQVFASHPAPIDLVITDAIMPIIGGRELVDRLRAYSPDISILIASGYIQEAYTDQAPLPAGVRFLQKPFTARSLLASVRQSLIS
jgi:CheY-like chemotaxis protein